MHKIIAKQSVCGYPRKLKSLISVSIVHTTGTCCHAILLEIVYDSFSFHHNIWKIKFLVVAVETKCSNAVL